MRNGFATIGTLVHDEAEAVGKVEFFRESAGGEEQVAEEGLVGESGFADARDKFFRNDQQVNRCLGMHVVKGNAEVILVLELGGDFAVDDALEDGFGHKGRLLTEDTEDTEELCAGKFGARGAASVGSMGSYKNKS